jgi:hypothetical protein
MPHAGSGEVAGLHKLQYVGINTVEISGTQLPMMPNLKASVQSVSLDSTATLLTWHHLALQLLGLRSWPEYMFRYD